jgi:hypothetical protein
LLAVALAMAVAVLILCTHKFCFKWFVHQILYCKQARYARAIDWKRQAMLFS